MLPSPIQLAAIPQAKIGLDMIVQSKSGTGKTCVYVVTALEMIRVCSRLFPQLLCVIFRDVAAPCEFDSVLRILFFVGSGFGSRFQLLRVQCLTKFGIGYKGCKKLKLWLFRTVRVNMFPIFFFIK